MAVEPARDSPLQHPFGTFHSEMNFPLSDKGFTSEPTSIDVICFKADCGIGDYSISLCRELAKFASVRLLTSASFDIRFSSLGFSVTTPFRRTRHLPLDLVACIRLILQRRPQLIIFQSWIRAPLLERAIVATLRRFGIRCFVTVHDALPHHPHFWSKHSVGAFFRGFDGLIAHSHSAARQLREMGVEAPLLVVPHGSYDLFDTLHLTQSQARSRFSYLKPGDFVVLYFGRLDTRKGIFEFAQAARRSAARTEVRFIAAGINGLSQAELSRLKELTDGTPFVLDCRRIPFEEVQFFFAACDAVALPYREGTTSGVAKIALAFQRPVIATPVGDLPETVTPERGVLLAPGDIPEQLDIAINQLRHSKPPSRSTGSVDEFAWGPIARKYFEFVTAVPKPGQSTHAP